MIRCYVAATNIGGGGNSGGIVETGMNKNACYYR